MADALSGLSGEGEQGVGLGFAVFADFCGQAVLPARGDGLGAVAGSGEHAGDCQVGIRICLCAGLG